MDTVIIPRRFDFARDSFGFANELVWEYQMDAATGRRMVVPRRPKPDFSHRCFALVRMARQFFYHAHFAAEQSGASVETYRQLIGAVMNRHPRTPSKPEERILIPGFACLREFSRSQPNLFKVECGSAWRSYFLRSHWRMIFPFPRAQQTRTAESLAALLRKNHLPIIHLVKFPALTINHAMVLFEGQETRRGWEFAAYDPNNAEAPERLTFDRETQSFVLPANACWLGGKLNVSHIGRSWFF